MNTALYFPRIQVPESAWFSQVLLYWDSVASIVPSTGGAEHVSEYMRHLNRAGLLKFVSPERAVREHGYRLADDFLDLVNRDRANSRLVPEVWTRLHVEKMEMDVLSRLQELGLARPVEGGFSVWWEVEERLASIYMSFLVGLICGSSPGYVPVTDRVSSVADLATAGRSIESRLALLRFSALLSVLPVPNRPVPAVEIQKFKERHFLDLERMRIHLDAALVEVLSIEDDELRSIKAKGVKQEIADEVSRLTEGMERRRWPRVVFMGIGGVLGAGLALAGSLLTGGSALAIGLAIGGGAASLTTAGYQTFDTIRAPQVDRRSPYLYAAMGRNL